MSSNFNVVEMNDISKSFFGVKVLDNVSFAVTSGEIHALAGENGAGKSTLMKILQGVYTLDSGEIQVAGEKASIHSFQDARKYGIGMVFQEFSLVPELSVAQNIFLDREHKNRFHLFDEKETIRQSKLVMEELGLDIDVTAKVSSLGRAFQQLTEIAKAIAGDAKILILDEPTASLAKEEVDALFKVLKQLTARGVSIVYISHRMDEIYRICDRITILRDGKKIAVSLLSEISPQEIIAHITGRKDVEMLTHEGKSVLRSSTPIFEASGIKVGSRVNNVSFKLYPGEILGLAGLMGSGRTELVRAIFGLDKKDGGALKIDGQEVVIKNPREAIAHGFALIPEDRRRQGLVMEHSVKQNILAANLSSLSHLNFLSFSKINNVVQDSIESFEVRPSDANREVRLLSGGNQQKVVIAKWMATNPKIVLMDEPTVGVDIGTKVEIMKLVRSIAAEGKSVILISSELPELLGVCDRILVIRKGEIAEELDRKDVRDEDHLQMIVQGIKV
jgi:ribose transport system ATP-binding protein